MLPPFFSQQLIHQVVGQEVASIDELFQQGTETANFSLFLGQDEGAQYANNGDPLNGMRQAPARIPFGSSGPPGYLGWPSVP